MAELFQEIQDYIGKTNRDMAEYNKSAIREELNTNIKKHIENIPQSPVTRRVSHDASNSFSRGNRPSYEELLKRLGDAQEKIIGYNNLYHVNLPTKDILEFIDKVLPLKSRIIYDYNDKFDISKKFEDWAYNFEIFEDKPYISSHFSSDEEFLTKDSSLFQKYFDDKGKIKGVSNLIAGSTGNAYKKYKQTLDMPSKEDLLLLELIEDKTNHRYKDVTQPYERALRRIDYTNRLEKKRKKSWKSTSKENLEKLIIGKDPRPVINKNIIKDYLEGEKLRPSEALVFSLSKGGIDSLSMSDKKKTAQFTDNLTPGEEYALKIDHKKVLDRFTSFANSSVGNLTIRNTTYGAKNPNEISRSSKLWEKDFAAIGMMTLNNFKINWCGICPNNKKSRDGYIGDAIIAMYEDADALSISYNRWNNYYHRGCGLSSKTVLDLQDSIEMNVKFDTSIHHRLHATTVIGFPMYSVFSGHRGKGFISLNQTSIPTNTEYKDFSLGRQKAQEKNYKELKFSDYPTIRNNGAIQALMRSGPDFFSNMYDVVIFGYEDSLGKPIKMINLYVDPEIADLGSAPSGSSNDLVKNLPTSSIKMLKNVRDFMSRVVTIDFPSAKRGTANYVIAGQTINVPTNMNEQNFSATLSISLDAGLEYMRLFNSLAGLRWGSVVGENNSVNGLANQNMRPLRVRYGKQKLGIIVKLLSLSPYIHTDIEANKKMLIFDDVRFLGGGSQISFDSDPSLVNLTENFTYKSLSITNFIKSTDEGASGKRKLDGFNTYTLNYNEKLQQPKYGMDKE